MQLSADAAYAGYYQLSLVLPLPDTFEAFLDQYLQPFLKRFPETAST